MVKVIWVNKKSTILVQKETNWKFYTDGTNPSTYRPLKLFFYKKDLANKSMFDWKNFISEKRVGLSNNSDNLVYAWILDLSGLEEPPIFEDTFKIITFNQREYRVSLVSQTTGEEIEMSLSDFWKFIVKVDVKEWVFKWIFTFVQKWGVIQIQPINI